MIERQSSADRVNKIVNDPSIYPWICGPLTEAIDLTESLKSGRYVALFGEYGGFLFWRVADGIYDAHSAVLPDGRGPWAMDAAKEALSVMFSGDADEIMMTVPRGNLAVRALVRSLRAKFRGKIENGWMIGGKPVDADVFSLTKSDWMKCQL